MRAAVERNVNAQLGAGVEHLLLLWIFAHRVHERAVWNSIHDRTPRFPEIGRLVDVRFEIVELVSVDRRVCGFSVAWRSFDQIDRAPLRHFRTDVAPMRAVIAAYLNQSIVRARP